MLPQTPTGPESNLTQLPAWDEAAALSAVDGDAKLARELVGALIAGLPAELTELRALAGRNERGCPAHRRRREPVGGGGRTAYRGLPLNHTVGRPQSED
jgi:hypothetical protein